MMDKKTQNKTVLAWLIDGRTLTAKDADRMWGITRLAARVYDLTVDGWSIKSARVRVTNRHGLKVTVAEYRMDQIVSELMF